MEFKSKLNTSELYYYIKMENINNKLKAFDILVVRSQIEFVRKLTIYLSKTYQITLCTNTNYANNLYQPNSAYDSINIIKASQLKQQLINQETKSNLFIFDEFFLRNKDTDLCLSLAMNMSIKPKIILLSPFLTDGLKELCNSLMKKYTLEIMHFIQEDCNNDKNNSMIYESANFNSYNDSNLYYQAAICASKSTQTLMIVVPNKDRSEFVFNLLKKMKFTNIIYINEESKNLKFNKNEQNIIFVVTSDVQHLFYEQHKDIIELVIDTMIRSSQYKSVDESLNSNLDFTSKDNCVKCAKYICMLSSSQYGSLHVLVPELATKASYYDIVEMKSHNIDTNQIYQFFDDQRINDTYQYQIGYLEKAGFFTSNDIYKFCIAFPLSIRRASMLYYIRKSKDVNSLLLMSVICTLEYFDSSLFVNRRRIAQHFMGYSMLDTLIHIWVHIYRNLNPFNKEQLQAFCTEYMIDYYKLRKIINLLKQCIMSSYQVKYC